MEGEEELVMVVGDLGKIGGKPKGFGDFLQAGGAGSTSFQVRDVGDDPPNGPGPGEGGLE